MFLPTVTCFFSLRLSFVTIRFNPAQSNRFTSYFFLSLRFSTFHFAAHCFNVPGEISAKYVVKLSKTMKLWGKHKRKVGNMWFVWEGAKISNINYILRIFCVGLSKCSSSVGVYNKVIVGIYFWKDFKINGRNSS